MRDGGLQGAFDFAGHFGIQLWFHPGFSGDAVADVAAVKIRDGVGGG